MIKAVIFDIDNTMYDYDKAHKTAMAALAAYTKENFGTDVEETKELVHRCADIIAERTGENCAALHNRLLRFQCFLEQIGSTDYEKALEMYEIYWGTMLEVMEPEPGLPALLARLKKQGIRVGIGSDMIAYIQYKKLIKLGVMQYLDFIVVSEEAGSEKPTPRFFDLCLKKAGCRPEECVFIGDSLKKDVLGASDYGFIGTWYHPDKGDTGAERSECASQGVPCRETWYHPDKDDTGKEAKEAAGYPVVKSYDDWFCGEEQEENR